MSRIKTTLNEKGQYHGPYQYYWHNGNPWEKSYYINGVALGYMELSSYDKTSKYSHYICL